MWSIFSYSRQRIIMQMKLCKDKMKHLKGLFYATKLETWKDSRTPNKDIMYSSHLKTMQKMNILRGRHSVNRVEIRDI